MFLNSNIIKKSKHFIMLGDINVCYLTDMYGSEDYLNTHYTNGIINTIQGPTRVEFHNNNLVSSCLDHINVKTSSNTFFAFILEDKLSDHYWTGIVLGLRKPPIGTACRSEDGPRDVKLTVLSTKKVNESILKKIGTQCYCFQTLKIFKITYMINLIQYIVSLILK